MTFNTTTLRRVDRFFTLALFELCSTFLFFSILPVSRLADWCKVRCDDASYQLNIVQYYYLPLVGIVNALIVTAAAFGLFWLGFPAPVAATLGAILYPTLYGFIHYDGVSDCMDAMFAFGKDRFKVLTDPHAGALGTIYTTACFLTQALLNGTLLYASLTTTPYAFLGILVPALISRIATFHLLVKHYPDHHPQHLEHLFPSYHPEEFLAKAYKAYLIIMPISLFTLVLFIPALALPILVSFAAACYVNFKLMPALIRTLGFCYGDLLGLCICVTEMLAAFMLIPYYLP